VLFRSAALVEALGPEILTADGGLDRPALRARIAADPQVRRTVEGITHPAIRAHLARELAALAAEGQPVAVVEAALLVETGSYRQYDLLLVVTCDPATQLARLLERDGADPEQARALVAAQLPLADKEAVADVLIRNDGDRAALEAETARAWEQVRTRLGLD
jgi:dephospho-CoA kinase